MCPRSSPSAVSKPTAGRPARLQSAVYLLCSSIDVLDHDHVCHTVLGLGFVKVGGGGGGAVHCVLCSIIIYYIILHIYVIMDRKKVKVVTPLLYLVMSCHIVYNNRLE